VGKICIALFHVSEHVDHFKAIKKIREKLGNSFGKKKNYFLFFFEGFP
jgi:hypothetical protein